MFCVSITKGNTTLYDNAMVEYGERVQYRRDGILKRVFQRIFFELDIIHFEMNRHSFINQPLFVVF